MRPGRARAVSDNLNRGVIAVCVAFVLAMLSISFIGFFYMVVTGAALSWTYSLARLFIPWIGMLSITVAFKSGEHVAMAVLLERLPAGLAAFLRYVILSIVALFGAMMVWFGWEFVVNSTQHYMVSDQLQVHHRWVVACVPVTGLILLIHLASGADLLRPRIADDGEVR